MQQDHQNLWDRWSLVRPDNKLVQMMRRFLSGEPAQDILSQVQLVNMDTAAKLRATMKTCKFVSLALLGLIAILAPNLVRADGESENHEWAAPSQVAPKKDSARINDPRLPPLLPGEEVNAGGNTIRMWTTSGPVPVSEAPEPFAAPSAPRLGTHHDQSELGDIGVIVDQRKRK